MRRQALPSVLTLLAVAALLTAPPAGAQKTFKDVTDVVVVEIPVTVTVDGEPLRGLSADNFEVLDGRKKQPLVGFDVVDLTAPASQRPRAEPIPAAGRRHFLLLFDVTFSDIGALARAREAAQDLVREGLHPEDLAAVAVYSVQRGPMLVLGFTPDRAQLQLALETLGNPDQVRRSNDPLRLVFADPGAGPTAGGGGGAEGRAESAAAVEGYLQSLTTSVATTDRRVLEDQVRSMTKQMADLARLLDGVKGRKYVVLLSEGFDDSLLVGRGGGSAAGPRRNTGGSVDITDTATSGNNPADDIASGNLSEVSSEALFGSGQVLNAMQTMLQEFVRSDAVIQAVDIGGLRAGGSVRAETSGANALSQMASETGGEVFRNTNDLSGAMQQMLDKTSVTYLLAIQPENLKLDGDFHRLKIRLKDAPRGAEARHRPGYYAPRPLKEQSPVERQLRTADRILGAEGGQIATAVLATPFQSPGGEAYVPLIIEVGGANLVAGTSGNVLPVEIYAYALDDSGSVHDFFAHTLPIDLGQVGDALRASGIKYFGHFDLAPGRYTVRVLVRNLETGLETLQVQPLEVPDFAGGPVLSAPLFPEPMGKWVLLREGDDRQSDFPYPFMLQEGPYLPAAAPTVGRQGEQRVPVVAYNLGTGPVDVKARLLAADGSERPGLTLTGVERFTTSMPGAQTLLLNLAHSGVAPGEYTLEVRVADPVSGETTVVTSPLVVAGRA